MYAIPDLETFVQVARYGGITAAARAQGISAATASHRIAKLEQALKLTLFRRNSRSFALTDEGQIFLDRVEGILEDLQQAEVDAGGGRAPLRGHLRVTLAPWILRRFILPRIQTFREAHPDLSIEFLALDRTVSLVEEGQDCAIRVGQLEDSALVARKLCDNDIVLCAAPTLLDRVGWPGCLDEVQAAPWVCLPWRQRWPVRTPAGRSGYVAPKRSLLVSNSDMLTDAAVQGLGFTVKSRLAIEVELETGRLVEVLPGSLCPAEAPIWYLTTADARAGRKTKAFGELVDTAFACFRRARA